MSTQREEPAIPPLTLGLRLRMSLDYSGMPRPKIAEIMEVTVGTISRWCNDVGAPPRRPVLRQWALACGVDYNWLETGIYPTSTPPPSVNTRGKTLNTHVRVAA